MRLLFCFVFFLRKAKALPHYIHREEVKTLLKNICWPIYRRDSKIGLLSMEDNLRNFGSSCSDAYAPMGVKYLIRWKIEVSGCRAAIESRFGCIRASAIIDVTATFNLSMPFTHKLRVNIYNMSSLIHKYQYL